MLGPAEWECVSVCVGGGGVKRGLGVKWGGFGGFGGLG